MCSLGMLWANSGELRSALEEMLFAARRMSQQRGRYPAPATHGSPVSTGAGCDGRFVMRNPATRVWENLCFTSVQVCETGNISTTLRTLSRATLA